jgi:hypothetical protein
MKKNILCKFLLGLLVITSSDAFSQNVSFNSTGTTPNVSAVLDLSGNTNGGFLVPYVTTANITAGGRLQPTNPLPLSLLVYNTTNNCFYAYYTGTSSWTSVYCGCSAAPATPSAITGWTTSAHITAGVAQTYSVTAVSGLTYNWTLPTGWAITTGGTTNSITVSPSCQTGTISVTATNSCGTSLASSLTITSVAAPASITAAASPATICSGSSSTLTGSGAGTAAVYTWTPNTNLSSTSGTSVTASPTSAITYTVSSVGCTAVTGTVSVAVQTALSAPTVTGPSTIIKNSTNNAYSVPSIANVNSYAWTVSSASLGTITAGSTTNACSVTAASAASTTYSMQIVETNVCGSVTTTDPVTVTTCGTNTITVDAASETDAGLGVASGTSFNITTSGTNELVVISINAWSNSAFNNTNAGDNNGTISVNHGIGAPHFYDTCTSKQSAVAIYWFVAPTAQTYAITVTNTTFATYYDYYAVALKGFCLTPSASDFIAENKYAYTTGTGVQNLTLTLTETASSYALASCVNAVSASGDADSPNWTITTYGGSQFGTDFTLTDNDSHTWAGYAMAGGAISAAGTPTLSDDLCNGVCGGGGQHFKYAAMIVLDIQ